MTIVTLLSSVKELGALALALYLILKIAPHRGLFLRLLWRKIIGDYSQIQDETLQRSASEQLDLEHFRALMPGFAFQNIHHARAVARWREEHGLGHDEIKGTGEFIKYDRHDDTVVLSDSGFSILRVLNGLFILVFILLASFSLYLLVYTYFPGGAMVKFTTSGTPASLEAQQVVPTTAYYRSRQLDKAISSAYCASPSDIELPFAPSEITTICERFLSKQYEAHFHEELKNQRNISAALMLLFLSVFIWAWKEERKYRRYGQIKRVVGENNSKRSSVDARSLPTQVSAAPTEAAGLTEMSKKPLE